MNTTDLFQLRLDHVVSVEHARNDSDDERADSHEFLRPPCRSCSQNSSQRATASKVRVPARPRPRLNRPPPRSRIPPHPAPPRRCPPQRQRAAMELPHGRPGRQIRGARRYSFSTTSLPELMSLARPRPRRRHPSQQSPPDHRWGRLQDQSLGSVACFASRSVLMFPRPPSSEPPLSLHLAWSPGLRAHCPVPSRDALDRECSPPSHRMSIHPPHFSALGVR